LRAETKSITVRIAVFILPGLLAVGCQQKPSVAEQNQQPASRIAPPASSPFQDAQLPEGELTPDAILNFLNAKQRAVGANLWQRLSIKDREYAPSEKFDYDLGEIGKLSVIRIGSIFDSSFRYLFFRDFGKSSWQFISYLDLAVLKYGAPKHEVEQVGDYYWFVIRQVGASGTGLSWYSKQWYCLESKEAERVLIVADRAEAIWPTGPYVRDTWTAAEKKIINGICTITFNSDFSWSTNDREPEELFRRTNKMTYVWNAKRKSFSFSRAQSTATERQLEEVYIKDDAGFDTSLGRYFRELAQVAKNGNQKQKAWLKNYLDNLKEGSTYRARLLGLLNQ
jgi:hypothetical protein